ncbi:hypothetical protein MCANUFG4_01243 [Mycoplasmopsis canis UFG4]|uniref:Uncharacterized protein n=2 Tax=Mycoplasmopsis canis TaxID=29555 RepID=I1A6U6_9BACT|nr:hypothetical protein [Mycoplasmopsis canis]AMD81262.1 hypothetical protein AXW82_01710 [Mycoplasmopsis canis PG 14]EIE40597.1 hypothetical protein MCANPG14_01273 [Mycoplasmopsis canis PG 14]EIE42217.1 hypothetical protein MCANUFG4_01243 [Mycoplasmopsis canis UFG4]VEU68766.1 Uncharacterised protein [Mycoplasmopsis canis]
MKKGFWKFIFSVLFIAIVSSTIFIIQQYNVNNLVQSDKNIKNEIYVYYVSGAVKHNGIYKSLKQLTYRELFFNVKINELADISRFRLNNFVPNNEKIYVPYANFKLKWINFENIKQLEPLKLSNKISNSLLSLRKERFSITWSEIERLPGIGPKTLEKLKNFLDLK